MNVRLDGFTHGGEAVGRLPDASGRGGKAVFVPGGIPGETVTIRVVDERKRWARAQLVGVVEASPDRVTPPCPFVPECGGCDLQHIAPTAQRDLKTRVVREQLERIGKLDDPPVHPTRAVGRDTGYRNNAQFHADEDGRLGFHAAGTHDVVPIDRCLVLTNQAQTVREAAAGTGASGVDVRAHGPHRAVVLHPGAEGLELPDDETVDVLVSQPDGTAVSLRGDGVLTETVAGIEYRFDATSFFQVNTAGAEAIVAEVLRAVGAVDGRLVWDLYAGVGLISLPLARAGAEVVAVEELAAATVWCTTNAEAAGLGVRVETDDVEDWVAEQTAVELSFDRPDVIVLDPPRAGAGIDTCRRLTQLGPERIVYVACDPAALARDARVLASHGYRLVEAQPLDLFPMTHHVEVVATFQP